MRSINQRKMGALLAYMQMGLGIIIGLLYTPIMIKLLGQSEYGLYNTVSSTISMLSVLSLGFNSGYIRYFAKYNKANDKESISKLNGLFLIVFLIMGMVALLCGLFLTEHLDLVFSTGLTGSEYATARVLMFLLTVNLAVSFPASVFQSIISAHEKFVFLKLLGVLKTVGGPLVTLPLLLMGYRSVAMVAVTVLVSFFIDGLYLYYVFTVLGNQFLFHDFEKGLFKSLFVYTAFIAINMIVDQINWNIDKILLGRFKGTEAVAVYSVGYTLYHYYQMFSTSMSNVFTPKVHSIANSQASNAEKRYEFTELFIKVGRMQFMILMLIATGLLFFGRAFIVNVWAGLGYEESYYVMILLVFAASIALIQNVGIEIQRAQNKHQFRSIVYLAMSILNFILSVYLCQLYGPIGSAFGTAVALILANGLVMNIYYHTKCNVDVIAFWKSILSEMKGFALPFILGIVIVLWIDLSQKLYFVCAVAVYVIAYICSTWKLSMNDDERSIVIHFVANLKR